MVDGSTSTKGVGNGVTVEDLSRRYHAVLLRYFVRRRVAEQEAQDLVQDVFARLARSHILDNVASVDGYLFATAANVALDYFRHHKVRRDHPETGFVGEFQRTEEFSPERLLEGRQELACIVAALNEMPERMRNIFILARLENLPRAEIAARPLRRSTQDKVSRAGDQITMRNLNIQPTITIRPGAPVRLVVHKDLVLAPWREGGR